MPTFDGGHYFLTVLVPIKIKPIKDGAAFTSPVHAMRKRLAMLPPAAQSPACCDGQSPFARNTRNHFARFSIIDDVAYNGREQAPTLWTTLKGLNPVIAQRQDHLTCPFLLFATDFDAASGAPAERDSHLVNLWDTMQAELRGIFTHCVDFDESVTDGAAFAKYIARCQIETTMPFNDYYVDNPLDVLPTWSFEGFKIAGIAALAVVALGLAVAFLWDGGAGFVLTLIGVATLVGAAWKAYASIMAAGAKPFPAAPDSTLPAVLKALWLQGVFTRFAIDNQMLAADVKPETRQESAQALYDSFAAFIGANKPEDLDEPTQKPGVIGI